MKYFEIMEIFVRFYVYYICGKKSVHKWIGGPKEYLSSFSRQARILHLKNTLRSINTPKNKTNHPIPDLLILKTPFQGLRRSSHLSQNTITYMTICSLPNEKEQDFLSVCDLSLFCRCILLPSDCVLCWFYKVF